MTPLRGCFCSPQQMPSYGCCGCAPAPFDAAGSEGTGASLDVASCSPASRGALPRTGNPRSSINCIASDIGRCTFPLASVNGCVVFNNFCSDSTNSPISAGIVHLQARLRKNRQIHRRSILQNRMRRLRRSCLLRVHHGILLALRKQSFSPRHEVEHSPNHQLDKDGCNEQSDQKPENAGRAEIGALVVDLRIAQRIEIAAVISGHVPILAAGNLVSAARTAATAAACRKL